MKKIIAALFLLALPLIGHAQQKQIYCVAGSSTPCSSTQQVGNGFQGDPAWLFNGKTNYNFGQLYSMFGTTGLLIGNGAVPNALTSINPGSTGIWCFNWSSTPGIPNLVACPAGTPGGSTYQLQYNNNGIFGAIPFGTLGWPLLSNGTAGIPQFQQLDLTQGVTNVLPCANGGTGNSIAPTSGALLIGNGTCWTEATLTAGSNVTITNGAGSITISASGGGGGGSPGGSSGQVQINSSGAFGAIAFGSSGQPLLSAGSGSPPAFGALNLASSGVTGSLGDSNGGTGLTATPTSGQLPIGNGSGYTLATLTAGSNISISNGAGSITINSTGGGPFSSLTSGTNTGMTALIGTGASLAFTGSGILDANEINNGTVPASQSCIGTNASGAFITGTCLAVTLQTNGTNNTSQSTLNLQGATGVSVSNPSAGNVQIAIAEPVNAQAGTTYTIALSDCGKQITFNNASSIAVTVPQANGSFSSCQFDVTDLGAGTATLTPTTSTVNGSSSLAVAQNRQCTWNSDGTNWQVVGCTALISSNPGTVTSVGLSTTASWMTVGSSPITSSGTITMNPTTGLTANEGLFTPNGSSGAVSLRAMVLADMPAIANNTVLGNTSGSTATPTALSTVTYLVDNGTQYTVSGTGACSAITKVGTTGSAAGEFECTGTTGSSTMTITLPSSVNNWFCTAHDVTTTANTLAEGAGSTTSDSFSGTVNASDFIKFGCIGF